MLSGQSLICLFLIEFLCQAGYVSGNPSGSRSENRSKRPSWRSGSSSAATRLTNRMSWISLCFTAQTTLIVYLKHPDHRDSSILFLGNLRGLKIRFFFWGGNELRHHCPFYGSPFPERLELPFSNDEILCGYEDVVSSGTDHFTAWVKVSPHEVLVPHMVDILGATADFREASEKETCHIFSHKQCQQTCCYPINCAEETQHLQLEPWAPTRER